MSTRGHHGILFADGTAWTPAALSPRIWADDSTSLTDVSGFASDWVSKGILGGSFSQATPGLRPEILATELNGRRVLRFTADSMLATAGMLGFARATGAVWGFVVAKQRTTGSGFRQVFEASTDIGQTRFGISLSSTVGADAPTLVGRRNNADIAAVLENGTAFANTDWRMIYAQINYAAATAAIAVDGNAPTTSGSFLTSGVTSNTDSLRLTLGTDSAAAATPNVDIACVIGGAGSLPSSGEVANLFAWAADRYAL